MRIARTLFILTLAGLLGACGFQLRGSYALPFSSMTLSLAPTTEFYAQLKRTIEASSPTRVVVDAKDAEANLLILGDASQKVILSLNAAGRAREFQLVRTFTFKVTGQVASAEPGGKPSIVEFLPASTITVRREITFSDDLVLSKESEEGLLWRDMQNDLVQQLMRRLATAKQKKVETED